MFTEASPSSLGKSRCAGSLKWNIISARASPRGWGIDLGPPPVMHPPHLPGGNGKKEDVEETRLKGTEILAGLAMNTIIFLTGVTLRLFRLTEYPRRREDLENCSKTIHKLTILTTFIQSDRRLNLNFSLEIDYIVTLSTETSINAYSVKIHVRSE